MIAGGKAFADQYTGPCLLKSSRKLVRSREAVQIKLTPCQYMCYHQQAHWYSPQEADWFEDLMMMIIIY